VESIYQREGLAPVKGSVFLNLMKKVAVLSREASMIDGAKAAVTAIQRTAEAQIAPPQRGFSPEPPASTLSAATKAPAPLTGQQRINGLRYLLEVESNPKAKQRIIGQIRDEIAALDQPPAGETVASLKAKINDPKTSPREKSRLSAQIKALWANQNRR
jgi:hypothetical protein